jgi:hypothetical protein
MPVKNGKVSLGKETQTVKLLDIFDSTDEKEGVNNQTGKKWKIKFPYRLRIINRNKDIVCDNSSQARLRVQNWNSLFYEKDGFVKFSMDSELLAVYTIYTKENNITETVGSFDINDMIGFKFEAVVVEWKDGGFIDWIGTFQANGIRVPTAEELGGVTTSKQDEEFDAADDNADKFDGSPTATKAAGDDFPADAAVEFGEDATSAKPAKKATAASRAKAKDKNVIDPDDLPF